MRTTRVCFALAVFACAHGVVCMEARAMPQDVPRPHVRLYLSVDSECLAAMPIWVAVTIENLSKTEIRLPVESPVPFREVGYRWELRGLERNELILEGRSPVPSLSAVDPLVAQSARRRIPAESRHRLLFPLRGSEKTKPGKCRLGVTFLDTDGKDLAPPVSSEVTVRNAVPQEALVLAGFGGFGDALRPLKPETDMKSFRLPDALKGAVGFDVLYRVLLRPETPVDEIPLSIVEVADTALYEPEVAVLRYELLLAKKDAGEASKVRKRAKEKWPEVAWLLERVDQGRGPIVVGRSFVRLLR